MPKAILLFATILAGALGCDGGDRSQPAAAGEPAAPAEEPRAAETPAAPVASLPVAPSAPAVPPVMVNASGKYAIVPPALPRAPKPARLTIEDALASLRAAGLDVRDRVDCDAAPVDAAECCDVAIDGRRAEIYRYDLRVEKQRRRLEQRAAAGEVERFGPFAIHHVAHPRMPRVREAMSTFASPGPAHEPLSLQQITPE